MVSNATSAIASAELAVLIALCPPLPTGKSFLRPNNIYNFSDLTETNAILMKTPFPCPNRGSFGGRKFRYISVLCESKELATADEIIQFKLSL